MTVHTPQPGQPVIELWTFFVGRPGGRVPLSRRLARMRVVTPNRLTAVALALGVARGGCFATGRLRIGGALFLLRFFVDCLDGTGSPGSRASCSKRGALFDLGADVIGVTAGYAALGWYLVDAGRLDLAWLLALLGAARPLQLGARTTASGSRPEAGLGTGGASHQWSPSVGTAAPLGDVLRTAEGSRRCRGRWSARSPRSAWRRCCCPPTSLALGDLDRGPGLLRLRRPAQRPPGLADRRPSRPHQAVDPDMTTAAAVDVVIATRNRPELLRTRDRRVVAQTVNCDITCHVVFDQCEPDESLASD